MFTPARQWAAAWPPLVWLVPRLLPKSAKVLLIGRPKVGKTYLALSLACALGRGEPWAGATPPHALRTLFIQADTPGALWRERLRLLGDDLPDTVLVPTDMPTPWWLTRPEHAAWLKACITAADPHLIILDSLRAAHLLDENDSKAVTALWSSLVTLCGDRAVLVIHHTSRPAFGVADDQRDPVWAVRGSTALAAAADAIWLMGSNRVAVRSRYGAEERWGLIRHRSGLYTATPTVDPRDPVVEAADNPRADECPGTPRP